jgi:hypothetical protein
MFGVPAGGTGGIMDEVAGQGTKSLKESRAGISPDIGELAISMA